MNLRFFRRTSLVVRVPADIARAAWRAACLWKVPRLEICLDGLPVLDAQRSQLRLRHLNEVLERKTGALLAIAVLIIGLADMVRTWNRDLDHMGMVLAAAIAAGLAGRIIGRIWIRLRVLLELLRLRWKVRKRSVSGTVREVPAVLASRPVDSPPTRPPEQRQQLLRGSCCCGTIQFTLSSPPSLMGTCHCTGCRKSGSGVFVIARRSAFRLTAGAEAIATWNQDAPHHFGRCFCSRCGTALGEITSADATFRLAAGCFDDEIGARNGFHEFVGEKPDWYGICDEARQFTTQPVAR